jgi:hypothetical protein
MINKYIILPLILVGCTAPVTDPPAHACSPRLDGGLTICPDPDIVLEPKPLLPKEEIRGEIDIYEPMHWHQMQMMFQRNARRTRMEQNATKPSDAINNALDNFWEVQNGSDDSTEQEKLL